MRPLDFVKSTVAFGAFAYLVYSFPALGQGIIIGLLSLLWLSYLHSTVARIAQR